MKWKSKVDNVVRTHHNGRRKFLKGWFLRRFSFHWSCGSKFFGLDVFLDVFEPCGLSLGDQQILVENKASHATSWALLFGNLRHLSAWGGPSLSFRSGSGQSWISMDFTGQTNFQPTSSQLPIGFNATPPPIPSPLYRHCVRFSALCPHILGQNHIFSICAILANPKLLTVKSPNIWTNQLFSYQPKIDHIFPHEQSAIFTAMTGQSGPVKTRSAIGQTQPLIDLLLLTSSYIPIASYRFI